MFKKCKENNCLNREMLDFFARQLCALKEVARTCPSTEPEIVADQVRESVELMEKRILFALDDKQPGEFHDYVADFYEDKLEQLRRELGREMGRARQAETRTEELVKQLRAKEEQLSRGKPVDFAAVSENVSLRNELLHSQQLIAHNQDLMDEQHRAIQELQAYVASVEDRESQLRSRTEIKVRELDEAIAGKQRAVVALTKEFERENRKREKEMREVQLVSVGLLEEKDRLEGELVVKAEEIKLLAKKVYDQSLVISKFERAIDQTEGTLLEEKIENNRNADHNKALRERIRILEEDYEAKLAQRTREAKDMEAKLQTFIASSRQMELTYSKNTNHAERTANELKAKNEAIKKLEEELNSLEGRYKELQRETRRLQRKDRENALIAQEASETLREKEEELLHAKDALARLKKDCETTVRLHEREKLIIKEDIETELQRLVEVNREALTSLEVKEKEVAALTNAHEQALLRNKEMGQQLNTLAESFEDARQKAARMEEQRQSLECARKELEIKLKHTERKCEELKRLQEEREEVNRKCTELEEAQLNARRLLKEKEGELEKSRKALQEEAKRKGTAEAEELRLLREELGRKDFKIREMAAKMAQLQEELRDSTRSSQIERENMAARIKELEVIINEQSDRTHRMDSL